MNPNDFSAQPTQSRSLFNFLSGNRLNQPGCVMAGSAIVLFLLFALVVLGVGLTIFLFSAKRPVISAKPLNVALITPANGSEAKLQTPLTVQAAFSGEISQIELLEDGRQISAIVWAGQPAPANFNVSFQWTPVTVGRHTLEVRAYGEADITGAATAAVNVVNYQPITLEPTPAGVTLTAKTDLTIRANPGESFAAVGVLPAGYSVTGLEHSADEQWWRILFGEEGNSQGWVPAEAVWVTASGSDSLYLQAQVITATSTITPTATTTAAPTATPVPTATPAPVNPPAGPGQQAPGGGEAPGGQGNNGGQPGLPAEAIVACEDLSEGATCTSTGPMGAITGTCVTAGSQLACMPEGGPPQ